MLFAINETNFLVPCSVYVTGPCSPETAVHFDKLNVKGGGNLAENVFFLGS